MSEITEIVVDEDPSVAAERIAVAGFLAGYGVNTRRGYATDLRLFAVWCREGGLSLFTVRRAHLELFARWMEETGRMRATVGGGCRPWPRSTGIANRNSSSINPALNVRRPKVDHESRTLVWTATSSARAR
jgi:integrase/recombinase XerD